MTPVSPIAHRPTANRSLTPDAIARYLNGPPPESDQFEFFVGDWDCELRLHPTGAGTPTTLRAVWRAHWLHDRRILFDDLSVFLPDGREILGWVNLRTYSAESGNWEITGQRVLEPATATLTAGHWRGGEMHLDFESRDAGGNTLHHVRFYEITPEAFEWEWEQRGAANTDWIPFATLSARRTSGT